MAAPPPPSASPPALPDELVEEILLRLPPDDPACILRASVVCKAWSSAICHPSFRRRLPELHPTPPVLGFLHGWRDQRIPNFVPITVSAFSLAAPDRRFWRALDCRHGRALFLSRDQAQDTKELLVWEPITGARRHLPVPAAFEYGRPTAAVFCAADGCDHRDCHGGPFRVVFVSAVEFVTSACVYSSETGTWGEPTLLHGQIACFTEFSSVLVGNSLLYFLSDGEMIQEYDLARHSLTVYDTPYNSYQRKFNLMLAENGELVVSESRNRRLKLWSRKSSGGTARWVRRGVIYLENLLPNGALVDSVYVLGFAERANAIFVSTVAGLFMIELQSDRVRKVCDDHGFCNLIPIVGFYTPRSSLKALGGEHHDPPPPRNPTKDETLKFAHELFDKGCKAMHERNFTNASDCFSRALEIRVLHYGKFAPQCASTFYGYGCALLNKVLAGTNPSGCVSTGARNEESVKITAAISKDDVESSSASGSDFEHVPHSDRGDYEEGENLNSKDQENVSMACDEANSDLDLAWKMLDIARAIVAKSPEKTMLKVNIYYALAEVSMKREDRHTAIGYYLGALAILEHLFRPDDLRVFQLNFHICAKAISACKSRMQYLKNAKEGLLADKDVTASAAKGHSEKSTLEDSISSLARILARLQEKLEELEQAVSTPSSGIDKITTKRVISQTNPEQNVSSTVARASSLISQMARSDNSFYIRTMSTGATTGSTGSNVHDSGIVSRGIKRANDKLISAEPSPKRPAADDSPSVKFDSS